MIDKVISGGQTGADRAGIDAAIETDVSYGGWLPKGRKAEDGSVPARHSLMKALTRGGYPKRTEMNVVDSHGTVVFSYGNLSGGSALTRRLAGKHGRPFLYIYLAEDEYHVAVVHRWIIEHDIRVLNVAGSRESKHPGIYDVVKEIVRGVLLMDGAGDVGQVREVVAWFGVAA